MNIGLTASTRALSVTIAILRLAAAAQPNIHLVSGQLKHNIPSRNRLQIAWLTERIPGFRGAALA